MNVPRGLQRIGNLLSVVIAGISLVALTVLAFAPALEGRTLIPFAIIGINTLLLLSYIGNEKIQARLSKGVGFLFLPTYAVAYAAVAIWAALRVSPDVTLAAFVIVCAAPLAGALVSVGFLHVVLKVLAATLRYVGVGFRN